MPTRGKEIILCEALLDALTFCCAGFLNVTAAYGIDGFTDEHVEAAATAMALVALTVWRDAQV